MLKMFFIILGVLILLIGLFILLVITFFWSVGNAIGKSRYQDDDHPEKPVVTDDKKLPKGVRLKDLFTPVAIKENQVEEVNIKKNNRIT